MPVSNSGRDGKQEKTKKKGKALLRSSPMSKKGNVKNKQKKSIVYGFTKKRYSSVVNKSEQRDDCVL